MLKGWLQGKQKILQENLNRGWVFCVSRFIILLYFVKSTIFNLELFYLSFCCFYFVVYIVFILSWCFFLFFSLLLSLLLLVQLMLFYYGGDGCWSILWVRCHWIYQVCRTQCECLGNEVRRSAKWSSRSGEL